MASPCFSIFHLFFLYVFIIVIHLLEKLCLWLRNQRLESASSYELAVRTSVSDGLSCFAPGRNNSTILLPSLFKVIGEDGHTTTFYLGSMDPAQRTFVQKQWSKDEVNIICATIPFGMGINKPDVLFVIHQSLPRPVEGYHQVKRYMHEMLNIHGGGKHLPNPEASRVLRYLVMEDIPCEDVKIFLKVMASRAVKPFSGNRTVKLRYPSSAITSKQLKIGATTAKGSLTSGKQFTPALSAVQLESAEDSDNCDNNNGMAIGWPLGLPNIRNMLRRKASTGQPHYSSTQRRPLHSSPSFSSSSLDTQMRPAAAEESLNTDVSCCQWKHRFKAWKKDLRAGVQKLRHSEMGKKCKRWGKTIQPKKCLRIFFSVVTNLCW